jgi:hypothetical protein
MTRVLVKIRLERLYIYIRVERNEWASLPSFGSPRQFACSKATTDVWDCVRECRRECESRLPAGVNGPHGPLLFANRRTKK